MNYKHIIFDFDGVLAESNHIRLDGFRLLFKQYPEDKVERLVQYAMANGGLSRYEKIGYFFEKILGEPISTQLLESLAKEFSKLVKQKVIESESVEGSSEFLMSHATSYDFAVVSSSEEEELREVCRVRGIEHFFVEILGSPVSKETNIAGLLSQAGWKKEDCVFVGDSINDLVAARANGIDFIGLDSGATNWSSMNCARIIHDFSQLSSYLG